MALLLYVLFFLSGAAALVYQVAWVRSLSLVFGGSHLAVTTVLAVFMGGLALGSAIFGRRADATPRPLRLYGWLELGIAGGALIFLGLSYVYPAIYVPLARLDEENRIWLSLLRVAFAAGAIILPTTLMGGTLPVLSRFVIRGPESIGRRLSVLYALNTLGAVAGTLATGFVLLRLFGVTATLLLAVATNVAIGLAALLLPEKAFAAGRAGKSPRVAEPTPAPSDAGRLSTHAGVLVLWGIGASGFCALGYEVLWTRMLSMVVGTSVYSFAIMLAAFLTGIALGGHAYGVHERWSGGDRPDRSLMLFGIVQITIGVVAMGTVLLMRDLPSHAIGLQSLILGSRDNEFVARQGASFAVAFAYMFVPAFFMGVAFPLAGRLYAAARPRVGDAVGRVLAWNTIGAVLGSAASGFVLVHAFGIERSLQMLVVLNVGVGILVMTVATARRWATWATAAVTAACLIALGLFPDWGRVWDERYFAIFRNNQRQAFDTAENVAYGLENTEIVYYFEGVNEVISVIRPQGAWQAFIVNSRPEATTSPMDKQCQRTLGHLPMLLHPQPRSVFVLGTGTAMTLGATSIHPGVERIVLAEIERGVFGAARAFSAWNHGVLDDPRLRVVLNDGRNYLATTRETFDVVTADPIHPWSGGAAYLYTVEYFRSVAAHLRPGGIACQWLPIYELAPEDLASVVRTFGEAFDHVMVWLTHYDAQLVGSNSPILIDESRLAARISSVEAIEEDLRDVDMGTAEDFLSYFVMGSEGARAFARAGIVNTDDNLYLEFSAPKSMGVVRLMGDNVMALAAARESLTPYLKPAADASRRQSQIELWSRNQEAAALYDRAHALLLWGLWRSDEFQLVADALERRHPDYAPLRFLRKEVEFQESQMPRLVDHAEFAVAVEGGRRRTLTISAVAMREGVTRATVVLVDNERREVYGRAFFDGPVEEIDAAAERFARATVAELRIAFARLAEEAARTSGSLPSEREATQRLKRLVEQAVAGHQ